MGRLTSHDTGMHAADSHHGHMCTACILTIFFTEVASCSQFDKRLGTREHHIFEDPPGSDTSN